MLDILEVLIVFLFPVFLSGAAFFQLGKKSGHWLQNGFQIAVYVGSLGLYVLILRGILSTIPSFIYFLLIGVAFMAVLLLEILYIKNGGAEDKTNKYITVFMALHIFLFTLFHILKAWM